MFHAEKGARHLAVCVIMSNDTRELEAVTEKKLKGRVLYFV
jgi:hypothetical protein